MFSWSLIGLLGCVSLVLGSCPPGWFIHGSSCYFLSKSTASWPMASAMCKALNNSNLASIESADEQIALTSLVMGASFKGAVWLDGTDVVLDGHWVWAKNLQPLVYSNFPHFDNIDVTQNCLVMDGHRHFEWHDRDCAVANNYICELP